MVAPHLAMVLCRCASCVCLIDAPVTCGMVGWNSPIITGLLVGHQSVVTHRWRIKELQLESDSTHLGRW